MGLGAAIAAVGLADRNGLRWAGLGWRGAYSAGKAMEAHRRAHPDCAWCGHPATVVHHLTPVHVMPDAASDPENMVSACAPCHFRVWHAGNWRRWASGLRFMMLQGKVKVDG